MVIRKVEGIFLLMLPTDKLGHVRTYLVCTSNNVSGFVDVRKQRISVLLGHSRCGLVLELVGTVVDPT
jgi:hypothetical protein